MNRRQITFTLICINALPGSAAALNPFALSLAEALVAIGRSILSFFIKEAAPTVVKNTFLKSMAVSAVAGLAVAEAYAQVHRLGEQKAVQARAGGSLAADLYFINSLDKDIDPYGSEIALIDANSGAIEIREPFDALLLIKKKSASRLQVNVARLPAVGNKQLVVLFKNQVIGSSSPIVVA
jgi:uncharacterized iron-regulated membrane protein